jgi:tape measure domain-containing protein
MADEVIDILTRLSFEASDSELQALNNALRGQVGLISVLEERLKELDAQRRKEGQSVQQIRAISGEYERVNNALRTLNSGYERQTGLIGNLQRQQRVLQQQLTDARSREEIQRINAELGRTQRQLNELNNIGKSGGGPLSGIGDAFKQGLGLAGGFGLVSIIGQGIGAIKDFGKESFKAAADFEQLTVAFNTLLGSREKANKLLQDLQKFAQETPFGFTELTSLSKQLLAFGFNADEIIPTLQRLGDVAGGVGADKLPQIVYAFGQIKANGRLMGQDLNQLVNTGFNPLQIISEKTGKSMGTLRKEMEKGKITFKDVEEAFRIATSSGGKFFNLMQNQSKTTAGAISNLGDAVDQFKIELGNTTTGPVKAFVLGMASIVNSAKEFIATSPTDKIREEQAELNSLVFALRNVNDDQTLRNSLIAEITQKYPNFLKYIDLEKASNEELAHALATVNQQYQNKINLSAIAEKRENLTSRGVEIQKEYLEYLEKIGKAIQHDTNVSVSDLVRMSDAELDKFFANFPRAVQESLIRFKELRAENTKEQVETTKIEAAERERQAKANEDAIKAEEAQLEVLKKQRDLTIASLQITGASQKDAIALTDKHIAQQERLIAGMRAALLPEVTKPVNTKTDTPENKSANTLVDELQKKLADLLAKEAEYAQKSERITSESIRTKINAQTEAAIKETNIREKAAIREGKQTKDSANLFNEIRAQIRKNGDLQYTAENKAFLDKLEKDQLAFNLSMRKLELQLAQDRLKLRTDDLEGQKANIREAGELQILELNDQYDKLSKQAKELVLSAGKTEEEATAATVRVENDRGLAVVAARQKTNQQLLDADLAFFDKQSAEFQRILDLQLLVAENANAEKLAAAKRAYKDGEISYYKYRKAVESINSQGALNANLRTQFQLQQQLNTAIEKYNALIAERNRQEREGRKETDPVILQKDVDAANLEVENIRKQIRLNDEARVSQRKKDKDGKTDRTIERLRETNEAIQAIGAIATAFIEAEQRKTEALIAEQQKRVDKAKENASKGNAAILKAETDRLEKLEAQQRKYASTQLAINNALAISQQVLNAAEAVGAVLKAADGDPYTLAIRVIAAAAAVAGAIFTTVNAVSSANDVTSGFYVGGYTGEGDPRKEAGVVHKKEYVFDHKTTARIGKKNLEDLRYGRLELVAPNNLPQRQTAIDYAGMHRDAAEIRSLQFFSQFNTQRLEREIIGMRKDFIEAIDNIPVSTFTADARGMAVSIQGHIKHAEKMKKL